MDKWIAYRDSGRQEHSIQIKLLTEELVDCQQNFEEMKSNLPFIVLCDHLPWLTKGLQFKKCSEGF